MKKVIIYASTLNKIGGIETFILNFCKRMSPYFDITFVYDIADDDMLIKVSEYVDCERLSEPMKCDTLLLATAWGRNPENEIFADRYIQMIHADYVAYIEGWKFNYVKGNRTTHHVAVGKHVSKQFEIATPYKIDKVIHNLL